jgi:hypothetical protein
VRLTPRSKTSTTTFPKREVVALLNCNSVGHPTRHAVLLKAVGQAEKRLLKERDAYRKKVEIGKLLIGTGSGQVPLVYAAADL